MKKRWMFLAAELIAMIAVQLIRQWQDRDQRLPRGSKVKHIRGTPVMNFGWLRRKKDAPLTPPDDSGLRSQVESGAAPLWKDHLYDKTGKVNWNKIVHPGPIVDKEEK